VRISDPLVQTYVVAVAINLAGAGIAFYLWTEDRTERFLQFWALAWAAGLTRWLIHYPAEFNSDLRAIEGILIAVTMFFMVLGSYDLLPTKPWRHRSLVVGTATILLVLGSAAAARGHAIEGGYALFAVSLLFASACMLAAYRSTGLSGHVFAAGTLLYQSVVVTVLLGRGGDFANNIVLPLYNIPLMLSIVVIAHQRQKRRVIASERTMQKIFETAPTPIIIVRPPRGEIEQANPMALEMLGVPPDTAIGKTTLEHGVIRDPLVRQAMYDKLGAGGRVKDHEMVMLRGGRDERTMTVHADRIALDSGDRYILSFYDLTELRRAEDELRASAEQMRQLYMRLANVEDDERRALHAELHDQVGAHLSAVRLELDVAADLLSRNEAPDAQRHLASARDVIIETIAKARNLMAELRPPALDDYGLVAALRTFAESQSTRLNLPIHVSGADLAPRPDGAVEGALFRIAQEAVINAARHGSPTRVAIHLAERDGAVTLTVEDDGVGFVPDAPRLGQDHWGLKSMRERAQAIGGVLRIDTAPRAGTRVVAEVPREAQ
jgi:PAS domain S-box-containing protein